MGTRVARVPINNLEDEKVPTANGCPLSVPVDFDDRIEGDSNCAKKSADLFDHLVGARKDSPWQVKTDPLRSLRIDDELEFGRPGKKASRRDFYLAGSERPD